jgi:hypothetical protein
MPRVLLTAAGALLSGLGLLAGIASLAVPWGRYRVRGSALGDLPVAEQGPVSVFQIPGGTWYLLAFGVLAGLLAVAAFGTGRTANVALTVGPVAGILTALVVVTVANNVGARYASTVAAGVASLRVTGETAEGVWLGLVAGPLLGFGAGLLALARRRQADRAAVRVGDRSDATSPGRD